MKKKYGLALSLILCIASYVNADVPMWNFSTYNMTSPQTDEKAKLFATRSAADADFLELDNVVDLSNLANSPNLISEAKKLTTGDYITQAFRLKVPLSLLHMNGETYKLDPTNSNATIELIPFGAEGKTVMFTIDIPSESTHFTICKSGSRANLGPGSDGGDDMFVATNGPIQSLQDAFGFLLRKGNEWMVGLLNVKGAVSDFHRGMTVTEVKDACQKLNNSQFKQLPSKGTYNVWALYWLDMGKQYDIFGGYHYEMRNDKKWGEFYFDAQGRLMKWFLYM